jgi:hypothetical protein
MVEIDVKYLRMDTFNTTGLSTAQQFVDITPNEVFSVERHTSDAGTVGGVIFPDVYPFSIKQLILTPKSPPPRKSRGEPTSIMPLAVVIGTCKTVLKKR